MRPDDWLRHALHILGRPSHWHVSPPAAQLRSARRLLLAGLSFGVIGVLGLAFWFASGELPLWLLVVFGAMVPVCFLCFRLAEVEFHAANPPNLLL